MDFSYLDKAEYKNIYMYDDACMAGSPDGFFIRRYVGTDNSILHRHKYIQINYVIKGAGIHTINNKEFEISKGDIFIIPPYIPHNIFVKNDLSLEVVEFEFATDFILMGDSETYRDFAYLEPFIVTEEQVKPFFRLEDDLQIEVEKILAEVLSEYESKKPGFGLMAKALLFKLLVLVGRAYTGAIKGTETEKILNRFKKIINQSKEYIDKNYNQSITLNEVAASVGYAKSHFSYLFKAVTGYTFIEYLNKVRIENAMKLLESSDTNIVDIAIESGFNSVANFNKTFKQITGKTPKQYRK